MAGLTARGARINATFVRKILTMKATVYSRAANGMFTVVETSGLACLLTEVSGGRQPGATAPQRRDLANLGTLQWNAAYEFPTDPDPTPAMPGRRKDRPVQIEVDAYPGLRWQPNAATAWPDYLPGIGVIARSMDVQRAS